MLHSYLAGNCEGSSQFNALAGALRVKLFEMLHTCVDTLIHTRCETGGVCVDHDYAFVLRAKF